MFTYSYNPAFSSLFSTVRALNLLDDVFADTSTSRRAKKAQDVLDKMPKDLTLTVDVPGFNETTLSANIEPWSDSYCKIILDGKRPVEHGHEAKVHKEYFLDKEAFDLSKLSATVKDGVLTIHAPIKEKESPVSTKIEILQG
jgi:HSP20 family molecular chaperone IbpA